MRKHKLLILLIILTVKTFAQSKGGIFNPVVLWGMTHPFATVKIKKINQACQLIYNQASLKQSLDSFSSGGKLDDFRNVFFMAAFQQKIKTKKLRKLGKAHEKQNYRQFLKGEGNKNLRHDSLSMLMDLHNNEVAFGLAKHGDTLSLEVLKEKTISAIRNGDALIIKRNRKGQLLKCDGSILKNEEYGSGWFVPKCLVKSDYVYMD